jgi:hypothetical protein
MEPLSHIDWPTLLAGVVLGIPITYIIAILAGVHTQRLVQFLDKRKLLNRTKTKKQALDAFNRIKSFHEGTRDRYPFYILVASVAIICAMTGSVLLLIIAVQNGGLYPLSAGYAFVAALAAIALLFAVLLLTVISEVSRRLERFDDYKIEFEKQWGSAD